MPDFVLQLQEIDDAGKDYRFDLTSKWLDENLEGTSLRRDPKAGPGLFELHAQRNGHELLVQGHIRAELLAECSRCLGDSALHVDAPLTALLCQGDAARLPAEVELESEDLDRVAFIGHEVALDELVREHLLVECPMQPLCSEQCPGIEIPPHVRPRPEDFSHGTGVDPRLKPLEQLKQQLSGKQSGKRTENEE